LPTTGYVSDKSPEELPELIVKKLQQGSRFSSLGDPVLIAKAFSVPPAPKTTFEERLNAVINSGGSDSQIINVTIQASKPVKTGPVRQLRATVPDFIGRTQARDLITARLVAESAGAVCVIKGMGGIGKTELALRVAHDVGKEFPDVQLLVDAQRSDGSPETPSELLKTCIRSLIDAPDLPDDVNTLACRYSECLSGKRGLILIDNVASREQVFALRPPPGCALLVTTRESFAVPGMTLISMDGLSPEESRTLLMGICSRIPAELADQISFLCGYLPLALRAAGSLLASAPNLDPKSYANQLHDERTRLKPLGGEGVDIEVEASFNLSYRRLTPETALVFRQLSIFPSSFDDAAEVAVCNDDEHRSLNILLKHSLVLYDEGSKRYLLHSLMRSFARTLIT